MFVVKQLYNKYMINVRIYLDMVLWPEYVGSWPEGFPPEHRINLGRLTQDDCTKIKKVTKLESKQRKIDHLLNKNEKGQKRGEKKLSIYMHYAYQYL